ncbi:hypothetical protein RM533_13120 [Croceicoccus sp. F390]|uniref:Uncharacterized protein n=1 Tax=Croceicoccus esteveae TaxID=3075597 RepID=A0ABU2ZKH4_9SPHN|nr:hypothetical protein [Croceicoccus sp. F390]MDT0577107.1 hypothetical protein [Croceicoccus sp. F390]
MAPNYGAVDHVLPIAGEPQLDQRVEHGIPDTLFCSSPKPDTNRVPLAELFMHISLGTSDPQNMKHSVEETPIVMGSRAFLP